MTGDGPAWSAELAEGLDRLAFLNGGWALHPRPPAAAGSPPPPAGGEAAGQARYRWHPDKWLSFDVATPLPGVGPYELTGGVTFEPQSREYVAYAVNNLAPRVIEYRGQWKDEATLVFDGVQPREGKHLRVQYLRLADGRVVFSASDSADGRAYHTYFEAVLERLPETAEAPGAVGPLPRRSLRSVALRVHHLPAMVAFYSEAFGVRFREVDVRGVRSQFGELGGLELKLVPLRTSDEFERFPVHQLGFEVPDVRAAVAAAEKHGGRMQDAPRSTAGRVEASLRDPDGNTLEICGPR